MNAQNDNEKMNLKKSLIIRCFVGTVLCSEAIAFSTGNSLLLSRFRQQSTTSCQNWLGDLWEELIEFSTYGPEERKLLKAKREKAAAAAIREGGGDVSMGSFQRAQQKYEKKMSEKEIILLEGVLKKLNSGDNIKEFNNSENHNILREIGLISIKPYIIVCNVDEENVSKGNNYTKVLKDKYPNEKFVTICADIEDQITELKSDEKELYMKNIGLEKTGLNKLINTGYDLLNLYTFFTSGPEETRAWTIKKNTAAPQAAAVIHTDFEKKFIRAEAVSFDDFQKYGSFEKAKENGKLRLEGKDYLVKDGDVLFFRVNP